LLALLWGSSYAQLKIALATLPPVTLMAYRTVLATLILCAILRVKGERIPFDAANTRNLIVQSLLNVTLPWLMLAWGQQFLPSALAGVLNSTSPLFVVLLLLALPSQASPSMRKIIGALIGLGGVVFIVGVESLRGLGDQFWPQVAVVLGAVFYAFAALNGKTIANLSPSVTAAGTLFWGAIMLVPLSLIVDKPWTLSPSAASVTAATTLAIFCTCVAFTLYFRLMQTLGAAGVASQSYLRVGVSVMIGVLLMGERISPTMWVGLFAAVLGVVMINMSSTK
jgi:drug/metabolite transporter (DMT)-like permease